MKVALMYRLFNFSIYFEIAKILWQLFYFFSFGVLYLYVKLVKFTLLSSLEESKRNTISVFSSRVGILRSREISAG